MSNEPDISRPQLEDQFSDQFAEAFAALGRFNLAVFGKTGAGKSTLVNAIFGSDVATTDIGAPVTEGLVYHEHPDGLLGLYDSEGFVTGTAGDAIIAGLRRIVAASRSKPISEQIHAAWYVVRWSDRRFEDSQAQFVRELHALGLPVIVVLSQVDNRDGTAHPDATRLAEYIGSLGLPIRGPVLTNALVDSFRGNAVVGLQELLDVTYSVIPEAVEGALTAAQVLDKERKKRRVKRIINQGATAAAAIGATPIPVADAFFLVPNQVKMMSRITAAWGLPRSTSRPMAAAGALVLTGGATLAGRYAVTTLLKFVPGGDVAGSAISATVAGMLTKTVGIAWSQVCEYALTLEPEERVEFLASSRLNDMFLSYLTSRASAAV